MAGLRLRADAKLDSFRKHLDQLFAAVFVFFFAEHLRQKQHREAVSVGVTIVRPGIAHQAVGSRLADQVVDGAANVLVVGALRGR